MKHEKCERKLSLAQAIMQKIQLNNRWVIDVSKTVHSMVGNHAGLINEFGEAFDNISNEYRILKKTIEKESNLNMHLFNQDMSELFGKLTRGIQTKDTPWQGMELIRDKGLLKEYITKGTIGGIKDKNIENKVADEGMGYFGRLLMKDGVIDEKKVDDLVSYITDTFQALDSKGYNVNNIFRYMNQGDIMEGVLSEIRQSYKIDIASAISPDDIKGVKTFGDATDLFLGVVRAEFAMKGIEPTPSQLKTFIKDFTGEALYHDSGMKGLIKLNNGLRGVYATSKYFLAPFTAPIMLAQAFVVGGANITARLTGLPIFYKGEAVDYFLDEMKVLKGENPFIKTIYEDISDTWYGTMINKILPNKKAQTIVKGGWQAIFEMVSDNTVKRMAVATALSKEGWNFKNEAELLKAVKEGKLSKEAISRINANALLAYTDFRTNSSSLFLSRNAFSRWHAFNALQGYVINRASEVSRAIFNFGQEIRKGNINNINDFLKYIEDPANAEFRWLIYTPLIATKYSFYADKILNQEETTDTRVQKIMEYASGLNDFVSSWDATLMGRMFNGVLDYEGAYIDYTNESGEKTTISGGIEAGIYGLLGTIMSSMYKEMKVLNIIVNPVKMMMKGETDMSIITDQSALEFRKIAEGLGRFNLLPGAETYGLKKIPQADDFFSSIIMNISETNESIKGSMKLKKAEEIINIIESPINFKNAIMYSSIAKFVLGDTVSESELKYDRYLKNTTRDPIMKKLYDGVFDRDIFNQMTKEDVYNMFSEVAQLDMSKLYLDKDKAQEVLGSADSANMKLGVFVNQLANKIGIKELDKLCDQWEPSAKNVGMQKMFSLAEQNIPGSSRAILAYAAQRLEDKYIMSLNLTKGITGAGIKSKTTLSLEEQAEIYKTIIQTTYPYMYIADKSSWYSLIAERAKQLDPSLFGLKNKKGEVFADKSITSFVNSLGLMDMVAYSEGQKGNPSAKYINSVYSLIGKYVKDPAQRLNIMNNTYETIERMNIDPKMKATIKLGNALGNVDVLDKALKDPVFMIKNAQTVDNAIRTVFGTIDHINKTGMTTLLEELGVEGPIAKGMKGTNFTGNAKKQAVSFGRDTSGSQYDAGNRQALETLSKKIPAIHDNLPVDYKSGQNIRFPYDVNAKYNTPKPIEFTHFLQIKTQLGLSAKTESLVKNGTKAVQNPKSFSVNYKTPKWKTVKKYKVSKNKPLIMRHKTLTYD